MKTPIDGSFSRASQAGSVPPSMVLDRILIFHITKFTVNNHRGCFPQYVDYWREMALAFGFSWTFCVNLSATPNGALPLPNNNFSYINHPSEVIKDHTVVMLSVKGEQRLNRFQHPKGKVVYMTGADERANSLYQPEVVAAHKVLIPTCKSSKLIERHTLWSVTAMGLCLYDRAIRLTQT